MRNYWLRVIYEIQSPKQTTSRDQLFLVQDGEVKQYVDYEYWIGQVRKALAILEARQRAAQQALASQLAQRPRHC
jgi:hypothetical protein